VPDDTRFAIVFSAKSGPLAVPGGEYAYVHADPGAGLIDSYNSTGALNAAGYGGAGFYRVYLPGVGVPGGLAGNIQVTAAESGVARRCKVAEIIGCVDIVVYVACVDGSSAPADSTFTVS
jgi:hypothetical protein